MRTQHMEDPLKNFLMWLNELQLIRYQRTTVEVSRMRILQSLAWRAGLLLLSSCIYQHIFRYPIFWKRNRGGWIVRYLFLRGSFSTSDLIGVFRHRLHACYREKFVAFGSFASFSSAFRPLLFLLVGVKVAFDGHRSAVWENMVYLYRAIVSCLELLWISFGKISLAVSCILRWMIRSRQSLWRYIML